MMESVLELGKICQLMVKEKAVDKKNHVELFQRLIEKREVLLELDQNTDSKTGFTWHHVCESVFTLSFKMCESLRPGQVKQNIPTNSSDVVYLENKQHRYYADLLRNVVCKANGRGNRVKWSIFINHIVRILRGRVTCIVYGHEYCNILLKDILMVPWLHRDTDVATMNDLLRWLCNKYHNPEGHVKKILLLRLISQLLQVTSKQNPLDIQFILHFIEKATTELWKLRSISLNEQMLRTILIFFLIIVDDNRHLICKFGEDHMQLVMELWTQKPSILFKELVLQFVLLQLQCHYPCGVVEVEKGSLTAQDETLWKQHLKHLFEMLVKDIEEMKAEDSSAESKTSSVWLLMLEVLARLHHLFQQQDENYYQLQQGKRMKKHSALANLMDKISQHIASRKSFYWLQLLQEWLRLFPDSFSSCTIRELMKQLHHFLHRCTIMPIVDHLLETCLACVAVDIYLRKLVNVKTDQDTDVQLFYRLIKEKAMHSLGVNRSKLVPVKVLQFLTRHHFISPFEEFWHLCGSDTSPPESLARLVLTYVSVYGVLDSIETLTTRHGRTFALFYGATKDESLQFCLIRWFLPPLKSEFGELKTRNKLPVCLFVQFLIALCSKDPIRFLNPFESEKINSSTKQKFISRETNFLEWSYDIQLAPNGCNLELDSSTFLHKLDPFVLNLVVDCLVHDVSVLIELSVSTQPDHWLLLVEYCLVIAKVLSWLVRLEFISVDDVWKHRLFSANQDLWNLIKTSLYCHEQADELSIERLHETSGSLSMLMVSEEAVEASLKRKLVSCLFMNDMFPVLKKMMLQCTMEYEKNGISNGNGYDSLSGVNIQQNENENEQVQTSASVNLIVTIVQTLCNWCDWFSSDCDQRWNDYYETHSIICQLLSILLDLQGIPQPFTIILISRSLKQLASNTHKYTDTTMGEFIKLLKKLCSTGFRDVQIMSLAISFLSSLMPHLHDCNDSNRKQLMELFNTFWKMHLKGQLGQDPLLGMIQCIAQVVKVNTINNWHAGADEEFHGIVLNLVTLLHHPCCQIRLETSNCLFSVIDCDMKASSSNISKWSITIVNKIIADFKVVELSNNRKMHEMLSSSLRGLLGIGIKDDSCEKLVMMGLFEMSVKYPLFAPAVKKVLNALSTHFGFAHPVDMVDKHALYLFNNWAAANNHLQDFPFQVACIESEVKFYSRYQHQLGAVLYFYEKNDDWNHLIEILETSHDQLLADCFPHLLSRIVVIETLTDVSTDSFIQNSWFSYANMHFQARNCLFKLQTSVEKEVQRQHFEDYLDRAVKEIFFYLCNIIEEDIDFALLKLITEKALKTITSHIDGQKHLNEFFSQNMEKLQLVLFSLKSLIINERKLLQLCIALQLYQLFLHYLLPDIEGNLKKFSTFFVHEVVTTHSHVVNVLCIADAKVVSNCMHVKCLHLACDWMESIGWKILPLFPDQVEKHLPVVVESCRRLINFKDIKSRIVNFLNSLVTEHLSCLGYQLFAVDPLPSIPELTIVREMQMKLKRNKFASHHSSFSLENELKYFLNTENICKNEQRTDALIELQHHLEESIQQLGGICSSSDNSTNFLFRNLICQLTEIITTSKYSIDVDKASYCLGLIGPVHMSSLVFKEGDNSTYNGVLEASANQANYERNFKIFKILYEYIFQSNLHVARVAGEVLKLVLQTPAGKRSLKTFFVASGENAGAVFYPFHKCSKLNDIVSPLTEHWNCDTSSNELWCPEHKQHEKWIIDLTCCLVCAVGASDDILVKLLPLLEMKADFCEKIFPFAIHFLLDHDANFWRPLISEKIGLFFEKHCKLSCMDSASLASSSKTTMCSEHTDIVLTNKQSLRIMLNLIDHLRRQSWNKRSDVPLWESNFWLDLNYLHIAQAATFCCAYFTSVLYAELWVDCTSRMPQKNHDHWDHLDEAYLMNDTDSCSADLVPNKSSLFSLLMSNYCSIGDLDGAYGCDISFSDAEIPSRIYFYEQKNEWLKALVSYNSQAFSLTNSNIHLGTMNSILKLNLHHVLNQCLRTAPDFVDQDEMQEEDMLEFRYECAWKLAQWSLPKASHDHVGFQQAIFNSIMALRDEDEELRNKNVSYARNVVIAKLKASSLECWNNILPTMARLQIVNRLNEFSAAQTNIEMETLVEKWNQQMHVMPFIYQLTESTLILQAVLMELSSKTVSSWNCLTANLLLLKAHMAREAGCCEAALASVSHLKKLQVSDPQLRRKCKMEEALIFWQWNEKHLAVKLIQQLLLELKSLVPAPTDGDFEPGIMSLYVRSLVLYSNWLSETSGESPEIILGHLKKAVRNCSTLKNNKEMLECSLAAGRYADAQYKRVSKFIKSPFFASRKEFVKQGQEQVPRNVQQEHRKAIYTMKKMSVIDAHSVEEVEKERHIFLLEALSNYYSCLIAGDIHDVRIYRFIALWFQNQTDKKVNQSMNVYLNNILSCKFLPLMHQITARIDTSKTSFQNLLKKIIERVATEHPHHTLLILLALCNAHQDKEMILPLKKSTNKKSNTPHVETDERIEAAKRIVDSLGSNETLAPYIKNLQLLCTAYITLANYNSNTSNFAKGIPIPSDQPIRKLHSLFNISISTVEVAVSQNGQYNNIVGIASFENTFRYCGGITVPKILTCIGTDGKKYLQLLKGKDDIRQDAVLQRVFQIVNTFLSQNKETKQRNLFLRTYKVVPLSQRSGIIQWCEGTQGFGQFLTGKSGAHRRYYPHNWTDDECKRKMKEAQASEKRLQVFKEICRNFHPAFRHFFLEKFREPTVWFERRLAYIRSVAATSMVGYILGLGDRHASNILVDNSTAEVIHIDFGIAFDQGKTLPTPETVPFRLTRDVIDGMGIRGVQGAFQRCCIKVLEVLRQSCEVVVTVLEVLLYDPLCDWQLSPAKAFTFQHEKEEEACAIQQVEMQRRVLEIGTGDKEINKLAERALLELEQKMQGLSGGIAMTVDVHVSNLIQAARDANNLSKLYIGWQPHL